MGHIGGAVFGADLRRQGDDGCHGGWSFRGGDGRVKHRLRDVKFEGRVKFCRGAK